MHPCDEMVELISAALDGQLSGEEQAALDEHIAHCPACSALLDDLRALRAAAAGLEEVPAPAGFSATVMAAIAAEEAGKKAGKVIPFASAKAKRNYWKKWAVSAAAVAVVVLGAISAPSLLNNVDGMTARKATEADMAYAVMDNMALAESAEDSVQYSVTAESSILSPDAPTGSDYGFSVDGTDQSFEEDLRNYTGVLVLEGMLDALTEYEGAACSDGTVTYFVPADRFAELLTELKQFKPVGSFYTAGNSEAQYGKVIVQSN